LRIYANDQSPKALSYGGNITTGRIPKKKS